MRHSARQASKQTKAQMPLAILSGVLGVGVGGWIGALGQMGISMGAGSVFMKYSRDAETEADMVGTQIIYDSGYDPRAMVTFFEKMKKLQGSGGGGPSFLASHPDPGDRAKNVSSILSRFPAKQYQTGDSPEYIAAKKALSDVNAQSTSQTAAGETKVWLKRLTPQQFAASQNLRSFEHSAYRLSYPDNWQLKGDARSSVTIFPKGGASEESIAYGLIVSGFQPSRSSRLEDAMRELVQSVQSTNPGMKPAGNAVDVVVNGRAAKSVEFLGTSAVQENNQPIAERVRLVGVRGKGSVVLYMVFVAPDADFKPLQSAFDQVAGSFQVR
jgi:hypothetical protein